MKRQSTILLFLMICNTSCYNNSSNDDFVELQKYITKGNDEHLDYRSREFYSDLAFQILKTSENDSLNRHRLFQIADNYSEINKWGKLKKLSKFVLLRSQNNSEDLGKAYRYLGRSYENQSVNDSAYYFYLKSIKLFQKQGNFKQLCKLYQDQAAVQYYINDYLGSDVSLVNAMKIAKKENLLTEIFNIYSSMGVNSNELGDYTKASIYHLKASKILNEHDLADDTYLVVKNLYFTGYNFYKEGKLDSAADNYRRVIDICSLEGKAPLFHTLALDNLGKCKLDFKDFKDTENFFSKAARMRDSLNIDQGSNFNRLYLSQYYAATKDTAKAITYANEALRLSREFRAPNDMLVCLKQLSAVDRRNALTYSNDYIKISDSMQKLERITRNKFAKIQYETEEITQEKDRAETQKSIFLGIAIIVTAFGLLLLIIYNQRSKQKELLHAQSQQKAKEEIYELIQDRQAQIDEGRQIEKTRIARELHDGIMNKLASTRFNLYVLNKNTDPETVKKCLSYIDNIQDIEKEIRDISHDLNKDTFAEKDSFKRILTAFFEDQQRVLKSAIHIDIDKNIVWEKIESDKKINLYRILQEALLNVQKHANANHVFIHIFKQKGGFKLEIHDDGHGISQMNKDAGIGLQNIKSRVKDCFGLFSIISEPGKGTSLEIIFPTPKRT